MSPLSGVLGFDGSTVNHGVVESLGFRVKWVGYSFEGTQFAEGKLCSST
jgi:hypothetical protein